MKTKLKDLSQGIMGIYKLNYPNGKIYVGKSVDIKRRMYEHNNIRRTENSSYRSPCDLAIKKYGIFQEIEILEVVKNIDVLGDREKYWIKKLQATNREIGYNLTCGDEYIPLITNGYCEKDILTIRQRKFNKERKCDVYKDYKQISWRAFERIWAYETYSYIGRQYFEPSLSKEESSSIANQGTSNYQAKLTESDVKNIRRRYQDEENITSISKDYLFVSRETIKRVCLKQTWRHI